MAPRVFFLLSLAPPAFASPGRVVGNIDGIRLQGDEFVVRGWACQQGLEDSIDLHIYADHSAYDTPRGTQVLAGNASLPNEPAVDQACQVHGGQHRFEVPLPYQLLNAQQGRRLYVHGIRKQGSGQNTALNGSGTIQFPRPPFSRTAADSMARLAGTYIGSSEHPRVFITQAELNDLVKRTNVPGSFSAKTFARLTAQVRADLGAKQDWDAVYSGCDLDVYLHAFSYEPAGGYTDEIRTPAQLRAAMGVHPELEPPRGAAIVASRLALYAALVTAGAEAPQGSPGPDAATVQAKHILLSWANRGFRDQKHAYLSAATQFCDGQGKFNHLAENAVGLQVGRGVIYSVFAQDLLQSLGALKAPDLEALSAFHSAMFDLIRTASNFRFTLPELNHPDTVCELYSNHVGAHLIALLSLARLFDDARKFNAVLYGQDPAIPLAIPWTVYFDHAIYGEADKPIACYKNPGPDSLRSSPSFQTPVVAPGEIEDRYRHHGVLQTFGYTMGVLRGLYNMADIMRNAGIDAYSYRGTHRQSIEMATQYYACYGKYVGFKKTVTGDNARACPDYEEYIGQLVNDVETPMLMGSYRFPRNAAITELEGAAKVESARDPLDPLRFGRWTD